MNIWLANSAICLLQIVSDRPEMDSIFIPILLGFLGYDPEPVDTGTLAGRLIAKRCKLGWSQRAAARSLGIDPDTWAGWELGERIGREGQRKKAEGFFCAQTQASVGASENDGAVQGIVAGGRPIVGVPVSHRYERQALYGRVQVRGSQAGDRTWAIGPGSLGPAGDQHRFAVCLGARAAQVAACAAGR